jgi:mRNA interferase YafQ
MKRRGKELGKLRGAMEALLSGCDLAPRFRDHPLKGEWGGRRECHLEPDWLLIYMPGHTEVIFERTGSHSDLFE